MHRHRPYMGMLVTECRKSRINRYRYLDIYNVYSKSKHLTVYLELLDKLDTTTININLFIYGYPIQYCGMFLYQKM